MSAIGTADSTNVGPLVTGFYVLESRLHRHRSESLVGQRLHERSRDCGEGEPDRCDCTDTHAARFGNAERYRQWRHGHDERYVHPVRAGRTTCTGTVLYTESQDVTADGTIDTANASVTLDSSSAKGVYRWKVDFTGDTANNDNLGTCGAENFDFQGLTDHAAS